MRGVAPRLQVKVAYKERGGNPLKHMLAAVLGFVSLLLSITWVLHIILYVFVNPPATQFLNSYFASLDDFFPLFGVVTYGPLASYEPHATRYEHATRHRPQVTG